jgi:hypothetical protein
VGGRRKSLIVAVVLVTPAIAGEWLSRIFPGLVPREVSLIAAIAFVIFIIVQMLRYIMVAPRVDMNVLCAAIATYLMMAITFSFTYTLTAKLNPKAFAFPVNADQRMDGFVALYFSFTTLTTVGYGDVVPVANVARMLAMLEATCGMFFATILIARLVAVYTSEKPQKESLSQSPDSQTEEVQP